MLPKIDLNQLPPLYSQILERARKKPDYSISFAEIEEEFALTNSNAQEICRALTGWYVGQIHGERFIATGEIER
jgi:hypothetical protein